MPPRTQLSNDVLYAGLITGDALTGVFRSPDQGATWAGLGLPPAGNISGTQGRLHFSIVADPTDPNTVYVSGSTTPETENGYVGFHFRGTFSAAGTTWDALDNAGANGTFTHPDSRNMVFDRNGNLLEADDGGSYRLSTPAVAATRRWASMVGNLAVNEAQSVAYDSVNHVLFGGSQDNGTPLQSKPGDPTQYTDASSGDGQISRVDNVSMPGFSIHYTTNQSRFYRSVYNGANVANPAPRYAASTIPLTVAGTGKSLSQVDPGAVFTVPYVLNQVDPRRILIGTRFLYESMDQGNNLTPLGGLNNGQPQGDVGTVTALVYGGLQGGQGNADVADVGTSGTRNDGTAVPPLLLRSQAGGAFNPVTSYMGASVVGLATDPRDWRIGYVLDSRGRVWRSANATDPNTPFVDVTGNLTGLLTNNLDVLALYTPAPPRRRSSSSAARGAWPPPTTPPGGRRPPGRSSAARCPTCW